MDDTEKLRPPHQTGRLELSPEQLDALMGGFLQLTRDIDTLKPASEVVSRFKGSLRTWIRSVGFEESVDWEAFISLCLRVMAGAPHSTVAQVVLVFMLARRMLEEEGEACLPPASALN